MPARRYKDTGMNSFWGYMAYESIVPQDHFLHALKELFDWESLEADLILLYEGRGKVGRPPYPPVMIFKMLFLITSLRTVRTRHRAFCE